MSPDSFINFEIYKTAIHPEDRAGVLQLLEKALADGSEYRVDYRITGIEDGCLRWISERGQVFLDNAGQAARFIGVSRDITYEMEEENRRRQAEQSLQNETAKRLKALEALREKEQILIRQSRHAAMGEMIGNIAHQWRQPLNTLGLTIQQLELFHSLGDFDADFLRESVDASMQLVQHLSQTIDDFRNYFQPDKEKVIFKVNDTVSKTLSLMTGAFSSRRINIQLHTQVAPVAYGYPNEFSQVLLNILTNAKDALIERQVETPEVCIVIGESSGKAVVTIKDNAGGIPEEHIEKIFDPYFTTKGPQTGTGVGLFMSKAIVEKSMGGRLSVRNHEAGAEFTIEI